MGVVSRVEISHRVELSPAAWRFLRTRLEGVLTNVVGYYEEGEDERRWYPNGREVCADTFVVGPYHNRTVGDEYDVPLHGGLERAVRRLVGGVGSTAHVHFDTHSIDISVDENPHYLGLRVRVLPIA